MIKNILVLCITMFILLGCGSNENLTKPKITMNNSLITNLTISNNEVIIKTKQLCNIRLTIQPQNNSQHIIRAWGAGTKSDSLRFHIPFTQANAQYILNFHVENDSVFKDSTVVYTAASSNYSFMKVNFVDVAQGDGILIQTPEHQNIAVDGGYGSMGDSSEQWTGGGVPIYLNYVLSKNIQQFDYIVESHHHGDHYGGLNDIRNSGQFTINCDITVNSPYGYTVGSYLDLPSQVHFRILNLNYPPEYTGESNANCQSIVLYVTYGDAEFLLMGDAESSIADLLPGKFPGLSCDVLKAAHHGSGDSSSSLLLGKIFTEYTKITVLSYGTGNPYGHPASLGRFSNTEVYGTEIPPSNSPYIGSNYHFNTGTISMQTDGKVIFVDTER